MTKQNDIEEKDSQADVEKAAAKKTAAPEARSKTPQEQEGEAILAQYPDASVVYVTSNGFGFFRESDARDHAATLRDKTVTTVKRK